MAISIHAPREGGDARRFSRRMWRDISIHAPREGGDVRIASGSWGWWSFQSTPPARGATSYAGGAAIR